MTGSSTATRFHVLIAAAGDGRRFGGPIPKQYQKLGGVPVLRRTVERFLNLPGLASLRVIINPDHADLYHDAVMGLDLSDPIAGGKDRKSSINNAINNFSKVLDEDIILIHDGVRPLVSTRDINALFNAMKNNEAVSLATQVTDTLRRTEGEIVGREGLWALQTPQAFRLGLLKKAHTSSSLRGQRPKQSRKNKRGEAEKRSFIKSSKPPELRVNNIVTDDTTLISMLGIPVTLVEGSKTNIKITTPEDLIIAEKLLAENYETRTGTGFDVHAFSDEPGRKLILCGVEITHSRGLVGHSDADVGLHALTDALLGAIGEGDIGLHFPPSDPTFKNMDSTIFLQKTMEMLKEKRGQIINLDVTLICEAPKIGPYREQMRERVAAICGIESSRVNVKATTTEGLGFTGRGEGIAAQATATIKLPIGTP